MLRRALFALPAAVMIAALPAVVAHASTPRTLFTYDELDTSSSPRRAVTTMMWSTASAQDGGVRLASGSTALFVAPPAGRTFVAGETFPIAKAVTDTAGTLTTPAACAGAGDELKRVHGTLTVLDATYDGATLTSLAASYDTTCYAPTTLRVAGEVRFNSAVPHSQMYTSAATAYSAPGSPQTFEVWLYNHGTATTTPGAATVTGTHATDFAVTANTCDGVTLPGGSGCRIAMAFTPSSPDYRYAELTVATPGAPRGGATTVLLTGFGYHPPAAPARLRSYPVSGGVGLVWAPPRDTTQFKLYRRADSAAEWALLGDGAITLNQTEARAVDDTLPPGSAADYAVSGVGAGGEGPKSEPLRAERPASDPTVAGVSAIVIDSAASANVASAAADTASGDTFALASTPPILYTTRPGVPTTHVTLPPVSGPGTYAIADLGHVAISSAGTTCELATGTFTVLDVLYSAAGVPVRYTADFAAACAGQPTTYGSVRWQSDVPYRAALATPGGPLADGGTLSVPVGTESDAVPVTVRNVGGTAVILGTASVTTPSDWVLVNDSCSGTSLAPGTACEMAVRFAPTAAGSRTATLVLPDDTARGQREVLLRGAGGTLPAAPTGLTAAVALGTVQLRWTPPANTGDMPITRYDVLRRVGAGTFTAVGTATIEPVYSDRTAAPGTTYEYSVAAVNGAGAGPAATVSATPAHDQVLVTGYDYDTNRMGVYAVSPAGGVPVRLDDHAVEDFAMPALSPDGQWIVYSRSSANGYDLYKRRADFSDAPVRVTALVGNEFDPAWSRDGRQLAFTRVVSNARSVWTMPAGGGTPVLRRDGVSDPAWLDDHATLVATDGSQLVRLNASGQLGYIASTWGASAPSVSPDGRLIAFETETSNSAGIGLIPVAGGTPRTFAYNEDYYEPSWRGDSAALYVEQWSWDGVRIVRLDLTPASELAGATPLTAYGSIELYEPVHHVRGVHLVSPPTHTTAAARIPFAAPAGTTTTCGVDGAAFAACASPFARTMSHGVHRLVVRASGPGGVVSTTSHTWFADTSAPSVTLLYPTGATTTASSMSFGWKGADSGAGVASYEARYRRAAFNTTYAGFVYPTSWRTTSTSVGLPIAPGYEYCVSVRARDKAGNVGPWSAERCVSAAVDDRTLAASAGWSRLSGSGFYRGTVTSAARSGVTLTRTGVQTKRIVLYVTKCATCGSVDVLFNGVRIASVSLYGRTTARQVPVALPVFGSLRGGTLTIRTTSARLAQVDGVAFRRV